MCSALGRNHPPEGFFFPRILWSDRSAARAPLLIRKLGGQAYHDPGEDHAVTPAAIMSLCRTVFPGRHRRKPLRSTKSMPPRARRSSTRDLPWPDERLQAFQLRLGQSAKVALRSGLLAGQGSRQKPEINGPGTEATIRGAPFHLSGQGVCRRLAKASKRPLQPEGRSFRRRSDLG